VYRKDPVKQAQFVYKPGGKNDVASNYTGSVAAGATALIATLPYNADRAITLQATTTDLVFGLSVDGTTIVGNSFTVAKGNVVDLFDNCIEIQKQAFFRFIIKMKLCFGQICQVIRQVYSKERQGFTKLYF